MQRETHHDDLRVLFCEQNKTVAAHLVPRLEERGFKIHVFDDLSKALKTLETSVFHLILLDFDCLPFSMHKVLAHFMDKNARTPIFIITLEEIGDAAIEAASIGVQGFFQIWPGCENELAIQLRCAVKRHTLRRERKLVDTSVRADQTGEFRQSTLQAVTAEVKSASMVYARQTLRYDLPDPKPA